MNALVILSPRVSTLLRKLVKVFFICLALTTHSKSWTEEFASLPEVVVRAEPLVPSWDVLNFELGMGDISIGRRDISDYDLMHDQTYHAFLNSLKRSSSVCEAEVSPQAKSVTQDSEVNDRWLAAQEVLSFNISKGVIRSIIEARNGASVIINGDKHYLFNVYYSDGSKENWIMQKGYLHSSVKLFQQPVPGSLIRRSVDSIFACSEKG